MRRQTRLPRDQAGASASPAPAAPVARRTAARTVPVALVWEATAGVLTLTATTPRMGASYHDSWSMSPSLALTLVTVTDTSVPRSPRYVSRAAVPEASLAHDTTYTFSYSIVMRSGDRVWAGSHSVTATVGPDGCLIPPDGDSCANA